MESFDVIPGCNHWMESLDGTIGYVNCSSGLTHRPVGSVDLRFAMTIPVMDHVHTDPGP